MANLVLYRKYRPKTFGEIVGQEHIVTTLTNALRLERVGHAYLFVGPRGTGKTTTARLLARYVNCTTGSQGQVCPGKSLCVNCTALFAGSAPDLIEIDAASNRGVDEIRQLREGVRVAPMQSDYKVYIIDEAHMLTKEAVNALLKTLEEPPAHVIFILATTDVEKIPATIISRTQRFDFRTLSVNEIAGRLESLAKAESAKIDSDAIELLAQAADGSVRDGESLLEQILSFIGESATREDVMRLLGIPDPLMVQAIADSLLTKDGKTALENMTSALERGSDATILATRLAAYLRDVLLIKIDPGLAAVVERKAGAAHLSSAQKHAVSADKNILMRLIPKLIEAVEQTKRSPIPQLPLELVIIEAASHDEE